MSALWGSAHVWTDGQKAEMSKAFVKENDSDFEEEDEIPDPSPKGVKNYITPPGFKALQDELKQLRRVDRPKIVEIVSWAAGNGDRSENGDYIYGKKRLREIDRRMRFLLKRMEAAEIVDPAAQPNKDRVYFGATVTYADEEDNERTFRIVGIDEADLDRGDVSWISPIARALLKSEIGDVVEVRTPRGPQSVEVIKISYESK